MSDDPWFVYMVFCADRTIYTGITTDVEKRLREHNSGRDGARYTRSRRPVTLAYLETCPDRSQASSREYLLKKLPRSRKLALIEAAGLLQADG